MASVVAVPSEANLGDTPEQIKARYREVMTKFGTKNDKTFRSHRPGVPLDTIDVRFQEGKSQWESYHHWKSKAFDNIDSTGGFPNGDIDSTLKANDQHLTWRKRSPSPRDVPGSTTWLLGSNDPTTALAKAVGNDERHSFALWLLTFNLDGHADGCHGGHVRRVISWAREAGRTCPARNTAQSRCVSNCEASRTVAADRKQVAW